MASDALAQELVVLLQEDEPYIDAQTIAAWLRSEGREVVARELGLHQGSYAAHSKSWNQGFDAGQEAGQRETALRIAEAIDAEADKRNEKIARIAGVPHSGRDGMVSNGIRRAADIARSMVPEEESNA